tara:strand:+ start:1430 stop:1726 length:297 start_codon:yes stop_codon:yes gene_type:complete
MRDVVVVLACEELGVAFQEARNISCDVRRRQKLADAALACGRDRGGPSVVCRQPAQPSRQIGKISSGTNQMFAVDEQIIDPQWKVRGGRDHHRAKSEL